MDEVIGPAACQLGAILPDAVANRDQVPRRTRPEYLGGPALSASEDPPPVDLTLRTFYIFFLFCVNEFLVVPTTTAEAGKLPKRHRRVLLRSASVAAEFTKHLHDVNKHPLDLPRLCRLAQFLINNELDREAYEV